MNVNRLIYNVVGLIKDNSLDFEHFPPTTSLQAYLQILKNACDNDLNISRDMQHSLR